MARSEYDPIASDHRDWNAGRLVGAKGARKPRQVWAIRFLLDWERRVRDRALFDLAIDSKLRGCAVVSVKIGEVVSGGHVRSRAIVMQQKTGRPVGLSSWICSNRHPGVARTSGGAIDDFAFPSRTDHAAHISTRQYACLVDEKMIGVSVADRSHLS